MKKDITDGNKLIAEFMGLKRGSCKEERWYRFDKLNQGQGYYTKLRYHSDWNMLKTVVDEIFAYSLAHDEAKKIKDISIVVDIKPCFEWCVNFIKWLNKTKK